MRSASVGPSTSSITSAVTPSDFFQTVDVRDIRMIQRGENFGLALEAREPSASRPPSRQHFDGDRALQVDVGAIHLAHAADPEAGQNGRAEAGAAGESRVGWILARASVKGEDSKL